MRKKIFFYLVILLSSVSLQAQQESLFHFLFEDDVYRSWDPIHTPMYEHPFYVTVQHIENNERFVDKVLVHSLEENRYVMHLLILGPVIFNGNGEQVVNVANAPGIFWGWELAPSRHSQTQRFLGFVLNYYADNGSRTADSISIIWNDDKNVFELLQIDRSML